MSETDGHPSPPAPRSPESIEWKPGIAAALRDAIERNKSAAAHEADAYRRGMERAAEIADTAAANHDDGSAWDAGAAVTAEAIAAAIRAEIAAHANPSTEKHP